MERINENLLHKCKVRSPKVFDKIQEALEASSTYTVNYYLDSPKKELASAYTREVSRCRFWINSFLRKQEELNDALDEPKKYDLLVAQMMCAARKRETLGDKVVLDYLVERINHLAKSRNMI